MFDERLIGYVILKCVALMSGKRGRRTVERILRGSSSKQILTAVENFHLEKVAGILRHIPEKKVREIIERLMRRNFLYISDVEVGDYRYPMIFISEDGKKLLDSFAKTEEGKLEELRKQAVNVSAGVIEMGVDAMRLDGFLETVVNILEWLKSHGEANITEEQIKDALAIDQKLWDQCTSFFNTLLLIPGSGEWYQPQNLEHLNNRFCKGIRSFLGNVPEKQAAAFRVRYNIKDIFYHSQEELLEYYGLQAEDLQGNLKRVLNKFFYKKWKRRNWIIKDIMGILFGEHDYGTEEDDDDDKCGDIEDKIPKLDTYSHTLMLYNQGHSIEEIALMRGLKKSTIMNHFGRLIPEHDLDPYKFVDKDRVQRILEVANQVGRESLKVIKQNLPDDYEYGEISIALAIEQKDPN
jgi:hypothetical protein